MTSAEQSGKHPDLRAADVDREWIAEQLRVAHAEGRLDLTEFDQRVQRVWAARTYGELVPLTADLPVPRPTAGGPPPEPRRHSGVDAGHAVRAWAFASALNLLIWAVICVNTLDVVYPWWVWVAGPWGAVLLARRLSGRTGAGLASTSASTYTV